MDCEEEGMALVVVPYLLASTKEGSSGVWAMVMINDNYLLIGASAHGGWVYWNFSRKFENDPPQQIPLSLPNMGHEDKFKRSNLHKDELASPGSKIIMIEPIESTKNPFRHFVIP